MEDAAWRQAVTNDDIELLLQATGGFHDCVVKEAHYVSQQHVREDLCMPIYPQASVRVLFQQQFARSPAVEILFLGVTWLQLDVEIFDGQMSNAWMERTEDGFDWHDEPLGGTTGNRIKCQEVWWRPVPTWLGPQTRYGSTEGLPSLAPPQNQGGWGPGQPM